MTMCEDVIIHKFDGGEIICRTQADLSKEMPCGLCYFPPLSPAEMRRLYSEIEPHSQPLSNFHDPIGDLQHGYMPNCCLCPLDLEETASQNGYRCSKKDSNGEFDPFDTHFYLEADDNQDLNGNDSTKGDENEGNI